MYANININIRFILYPQFNIFSRFISVTRFLASTEVDSMLYENFRIKAQSLLSLFTKNPIQKEILSETHESQHLQKQLSWSDYRSAVRLLHECGRVISRPGCCLASDWSI